MASGMQPCNAGASSRSERRSSGLALINALTRFWLTMDELRAPDDRSANNVVISRARRARPFRRKSLPEPRSARRQISSASESAKGAGARPAASSSQSVTSARERAERALVPANIRSSSSPPRRARAELSPMAQRRPLRHWTCRIHWGLRFLSAREGYRSWQDRRNS